MLNTTPADSRSTSRIRRLRGIQLRQYGESLDRPDDIAFLDGRLTTLRATMTSDSSSGIQIVYGTESLLQPALPRPNAGLAAAVQYMAAKRGLRVQVVRQPSLRGLPPLAAFDAAGRPATDPNMLEFVRWHERGLITYCHGVAPPWLLAQMILAWPDRTFAVATATYDEAHRIRRALYKLGVKTTLATSKHCPDRPERIVISTYEAMGHTAIECNKRDIFICANAAHALGERAQLCLLQADAGFRLFGFLAGDHPLSQWEEDWLTATFGLESISIPAHGYQEVTPGVMWVPFRWHDSRIQADDMLAVKQSLVWHHHARNRWIAKLAKNLVAGDMAIIAADFPGVAGALPGDHACRVIVLVDGVEHALAVADRLPGWPILADDTNERYLTGQQRRILTERRDMWNTGANMIVTTAGADSLEINGGSTTVVIWASAGRHLPPLPPAWRIVPAGAARNLLIVDVDDRGHCLLASWARRRRQAYEQVEWLPPGADRLVARIRRFLRSRPGRAAR